MPDSPEASYRVQLGARFEMTIDEIVEAPAGLTKDQVEEVIDRNWWWISGSTDVLLESSWELERFEELTQRG